MDLHEEGDADMMVINDDIEEGAVKWTGEASFTNANYQAKKMTFLLFINRASNSW